MPSDHPTGHVARTIDYQSTPTLARLLGTASQETQNRASEFTRGLDIVSIAHLLVGGDITIREAARLHKLAEQQTGESLTVAQQRVLRGEVEHGPEFGWCADCHLQPLDPDAEACPRCGEQAIVMSDDGELRYGELCHRRDYGRDPFYPAYQR